MTAASELDKVWETTPSPAQFMVMFQRVRKAILPIYNSEADRGLARKGDGSPQTDADRISDEIMVNYLILNSPYRVLSKERGQVHQPHRYSFEKMAPETPDLEYFWTADSINGTDGFIKGTGEFSNMVGLAGNGESILGAVYNTLADRCYFARKGKGVLLLDGRGSPPRIHVSDRSRFEDMRIVESRSHPMKETKEIAKRLGINQSITTGSIGLKIGLIAEGKADAYMDLSGKTFIWGSTPSIVILEEAGGTITDIDGNELIVDPGRRHRRNDKFIIASNGVRHEEILEAARAVLAQRAN